MLKVLSIAWASSGLNILTRAAPQSSNSVGTVLISLGVGVAGYWFWDMFINKQQSAVVNQALIGNTANASLPRGIRNNNPGNLKYSPANAWQGQTGKDSGGFCIFSAPQYGLRATGKVLRSYIGAGYNTIGKIFPRYAPDANGLSGAYASSVSKATGIGVNTVLSASDVNSIAKIVWAIVPFENGAKYANYYTLDTVLAAVNS